MNKENKNNRICKTDYTSTNLPPLIAGKYFGIIQPDGRKDMFKWLNQFLGEMGEMDYQTWKGRFHNPKLIPTKKQGMIIAIMEDALALQLYKLAESTTKVISDASELQVKIRIAIAEYEQE